MLSKWFCGCLFAVTGAGADAAVSELIPWRDDYDFKQKPEKDAFVSSYDDTGCRHPFLPSYTSTCVGEPNRLGRESTDAGDLALL